jgi:endogenous inhibitor of DNA gyrase (YacG/DUF329 family)
MACPICQRDGDARYRPFCSRRCADIDLGRWLTGAYVIPGADGDDADDPTDDPTGDAPGGRGGSGTAGRGGSHAPHTTDGTGSDTPSATGKSLPGARAGTPFDDLAPPRGGGAKRAH